MTDSAIQFVLAMGGAPAPGVNPYVQLLPIAAVFAIFYFIILLPTKRKQQKVKEFLDNLKVNDRIITTSGLYGQITRLGDQSVQLQIADKIRIEVARASIGGYQGQPPVVDQNNQ